MDKVRFLACGDAGLLIEAAEPGAIVALYDSMRDVPPPGVVDVVPARRTLLLKLSPDADAGRIRAHVAQIEPQPRRVTAEEMVEVPVHYDGPDLPSVCALTGLSRSEVVDLHTGQPWTVAFCGFAPGFAYLIGGDPRLGVPRMDTPRVRVPAGSVGLAGEFTGVYPRESPGGWRLIGITDVTLWDLQRHPPAKLAPGTRVWFRPR